MFIGPVQLLLLLFLSFRTANSQPRCAGANVCDSRVDRLCRPIGGCESFCERRLECTRAPEDCYCRSGFARNASGSCISRENCPRDCGEQECPNRFLGCRCEQHCQPRDGCVVAPSGCHCARGYARDDRNACVPRSLCPTPVG